MAQSSMERPTALFYLREIGAICIGALGIVVLLALVSYAPTDLGAIRSSDPVTNLIGQVGAVVSHAMLWLVGLAAYAFPIGMIVGCGVLLRFRQDQTDWTAVGFRSFAWVIVLIASATLLTVHLQPWQSLPTGSGGVVGWGTVMSLIDLLHEPGLSIVSVAIGLVCLQLAIGFSWLNVFENTGRMLFAVGSFTTSLVRKTHRQTRMGLNWIVSSLLRLASKERTVEVPVPNRSVRKEPVFEPSEISVPKVPSLTPDTPDTPNTTTTTVRARPASAPTSAFPHETDVLTPIPSMEILSTDGGAESISEEEREALRALGQRLQEILADYKVTIAVESIITGPVVSRFEIQLAPGVMVNRIVNLANDLAREIAVSSVRVVPVIPGKSVVGVEIPNQQRAMVSLREVLDQTQFKTASSPLTLGLGKDISGVPVYADLERMPHLLVAGTTGSGKSVGINTMLLSFLYRLTPDDVRFIMIDPKMLELSVYDGIPHLLTPVVTDMQHAAKALQWCLNEMERRYRLMSELQVRNLGGYNDTVQKAKASGKPLYDPTWEIAPGDEPPELETLPLIVVVVDEFADMVMIVGKKIEQLIVRLAQKARAAGIHLILATQRPSVDVITGLIKANFPCRISYQVSSQADSRTILDQVGAEQLLGHGDMLYLPTGSSVPERVHGAFVSDQEVLDVIDAWRARGAPNYMLDLVQEVPEVDLSNSGLALDTEDGEDLFQQAINFVITSKKASASSLQTKFQIGWNKAARFMDQMESQGIVSEPDRNGRRQVLISEE